MKTIFTLIAFCICCTAFSQTVNGIPLKDINKEYIQIVGSPRVFSSKLNIEIDFGQENPLFSGGETTRIRDSAGKDVVFNSMIDALNFMSANGYEFVQAYIVPVSTNTSSSQFLLRRKKQLAPTDKFNQ